ncbi:hypothetical protein D9758_013834 [Tetrapyrgos nigripes]|uniref:Uncharacterized protein n=1 Tax=Tetrapyrgos nigripes TaxID=182062 RepID=A0A8H5CTS5_9AGAR|nr:hypothetical protein D9758_013834 [Tetrapyrgos nigripes]
MLLQRHGRSKKLANSACWTTSWPRFNLTGSSHCYQTGTQLLHSLLLVSLTLLLSSATQAVAVQFPQNFTPSTYPLAVKSTYLNAWISTQFNASDSSTSTLTHEAPKPNFGLDLGWCGMMRVDGEAWQWLGPISPNNVSTVKSTSIQGSIFTPTKIIFQMLAGPVTLNVTFLTPIETEDLTRQSLPFIYISLDVQSSDGQSHDVQVYSDITAEWVSGDRANTTVQWNTTFTSSSMFHRSFPQNPEPFNESNFQPQDGTVYYAMQQVQGLTWKTGEADVLRAQFLESGSLDNGEDTNFRTINSSFPAFAISVNLGNIQSTSQPIVESKCEDPISTQTLGFSSQRIEDVIDFFISDYDAAVQRSDNLDVKVREDVAASVSAGNEDEYFSLVSLSTRQLLANFELTFGTSSQDDGGVDIKAFARNTGVSALANNVPTLWGSFPVFLYLNATWAKYLLDSTLQYQHSFVYGKNYAAPDLGGNYPTEVQGNNKADETNSVKDTGLMLIMTLAYTKSAGDIEFLRKYYDTLKSWADYLTHKSFPPVNQQSGDLIGFASDDNSIIAIKGIIGIGAMAQIANAVGKLNDASVYSEASSSLAQQWQEQAVKSDHISLNYNNPRSFALVYDLYADLLLGTGLVNNSVSYYEAEMK